MRKVEVIGVGMTTFGKQTDITGEELGRQACWDSILDAGINARQIQAAYCGHVLQGPVFGQRVMAKVGIAGIPVTNVENYCSSGSTAFREAWLAIATGQYDMVLAFGAEKMTGKVRGAITPAEEDLEAQLGLTFPGLYAMRARRYFEEYGATPYQLALVSVKNRKNGTLNPRAQYQREVTVEEVLASRPIAAPLKLLDCCPISDGAAAAILVNSRTARRLGIRGIKVGGVALTSGQLEGGYIDMTNEDMTRRAAMEVYAQAGAGPADVDLAEVHDCFTIAELLRIEGLGLCERGEAARLVEAGVTSLGGRIPINPSGGLLAKGHPLGATGLAQVAELVWQLRCQAGSRQVEGARLGLAHCRGGSVPSSEGGACTVILLKK